MSWDAKRQSALRKILKTLREIDIYNITHDDAKMVDMEKFEGLVMHEYGCTRETANKWILETMNMYEIEHEAMIKQEKMIRANKGLL